jgi:diadenosine tetraphosphate (Ap4A) HIT family hydrolase
VSATPFALDATLAADGRFVGDLPLSAVLLMDDARFPWLIIVPRVAGMRDLIDLPRLQQQALLDEIDLCARALRELHAPLKLNVAALGNVVAQLHVHVIARHARDTAWPKPVWGVGEREPYAAAALAAELARLRAALGLAAVR